MISFFKYTSPALFLLLLITAPANSFAWQDYVHYDDDWNYHGSGRDHPYSAYIDRQNYVGKADYSVIGSNYIILSSVNPRPVPVPVIAPPPLPPPPSPTGVTIDPGDIVVNIPNSHGGINAVVIKKSGDGYIGPKGEYYPEFPKVFQLQMKYGD